MTRTKLVVQAIVSGLSLLNFNLSIKAVAQPAMIITPIVQDISRKPDSREDLIICLTLNAFQNTDTMTIRAAGLQKITGFR